MSELDRLMACFADAQELISVKTEDQLRRFFKASRTNISDAFEGGVDGLLRRWEGRSMDDICAYLLWDYIAYNIAELYNSYDLARDVLEEGLKDREKT